MLCVVIAQQMDWELGCRALEKAGLADPANRDLARDQVMFFTPDHETGLRGMTLETDDVFFLDGWDRTIREHKRYQFMLTLQMAGVNLDECGRLEP